MNKEANTCLSVPKLYLVTEEMFVKIFISRNKGVAIQGCEIFEPPHDKINKMTAHSEDSDQPGQASAQSDQSLRCPHEQTLGSELPIERTAKTLIRQDVCFVVPWLILSIACHCKIRFVTHILVNYYN